MDMIVSHVKQRILNRIVYATIRNKKKNILVYTHRIPIQTIFNDIGYCQMKLLIYKIRKLIAFISFVFVYKLILHFITF